MSFTSRKVAGKIKVKAPQKSQAKRPLKPIFPKLCDNDRLCYVCDVKLFGTGLVLAEHSTKTTNTSLATKIGNLFGNSCMIIVSPRDVVCATCYALFNECDSLEHQSRQIQSILRGLLYQKYNIADVVTEDGSPMPINQTILTDAPAGTIRNLCAPVEVDTTEYKKVYLTPPAKPFIIPRLSNGVKKPAAIVKKVYGCNMCDVTFDSPKLIRSHKMKAHLSTWTCHFCNGVFTSELEFTEHTAMHLKEALYQCQQCSAAFEAKEQLVEHMSSAHVEPTVLESEMPSEEPTDTLFTCIVCSMVFEDEDEYKEHLHMHDALKLELENLGKGDSLPLDVFEGTSESVDLLDMNMFDSAETSTDDRFFCGECGEQLESLELMKDHMDTHKVAEEGPEHGPEDDLSCSLCGAVFSDPDSGKRHVENCQAAPAKMEIFTCSNCDLMVDTENDLLAHGAICDGQPVHSAMYPCATCGLLFQAENDLLVHSTICGRPAKLETENLPEGSEVQVLEDVNFGMFPPKKKATQRTCLACGNIFPTMMALRQHEKENPDHLQQIQCPDCDLTFTRQKVLNEHRRLTHQVFHCRHCSKTFINLKQIKAHESRHERLARTRFDCDQCDRVFKTPTGLRNHKAVHAGTFSHTCDFCGKGFVSRARAEEHRASHTKESRYTCEVCNRHFSFQATYWIHKKWHENPNPYKCEECGRLFKHSSLLAVHRRKHTGERPYSCNFCDQSFAVGNTLKRHLSLHTGIFPYTCSVCNSGFPAKHKLAIHMSKVHQDNQLLQEQIKNTRKTEFKMVVKDNPPEPPMEPNDETWILAEGQNEGGQYLTLEGEDGERILLTEEMLRSSGDQLVEIIMPVDSSDV